MKENNEKGGVSAVSSLAVHVKDHDAFSREAVNRKCKL